jgi:hypothetical protein
MKLVNRRNILYLIKAILFLLPVAGNSQVYKHHLVTLYLGDCRRNESFTVGMIDSLTILQNKIVIRQVNPSEQEEWPITIENMPSGDYEVIYKNIFYEVINKQFVLPDSINEYDLTICPDELKQYKYNTVAKLKSNESLKIAFNSVGCFHRDKEIIEIKRINKNLVATLVIKSKSNFKQKTVLLDAAGIFALKRFENEIRILPQAYGCTTSDDYSIQSKYWNFNAFDGGCQWHGYYHLKKIIFKADE